jgi:hypothetical protein
LSRLTHASAPPCDPITDHRRVTSSSPDRDRKTKRRAYAAARVPLYLLVDRDERQVTLFDDPRRDDYATMFVAAFGSSVRLPPPFSFTLETDGFVA